MTALHPTRSIYLTSSLLAFVPSSRPHLSKFKLLATICLLDSLLQLHPSADLLLHHPILSNQSISLLLFPLNHVSTRKPSTRTKVKSSIISDVGFSFSIYHLKKIFYMLMPSHFQARNAIGQTVKPPNVIQIISVQLGASDMPSILPQYSITTNRK